MNRWLLCLSLFSVAFVSDAPVRPAPFFTEGNEIRFDASMRLSEGGTNHVTMILLIRSVRQNRSGARVDAVLSQVISKKVTARYLMNFACDSTCFYADAENWFYRPVDPDLSIDRTIEGDSTSYPLNMKVGDTLSLSQASATVRSADYSSETTIVFYDRKVVSYDTIATPEGMKPAFKIDGKVKRTAVSIDSRLGREISEESYTCTEWFSPSLGVILSQNQYGKASVTIAMKEINK